MIHCIINPPEEDGRIVIQGTDDEGPPEAPELAMALTPGDGRQFAGLEYAAFSDYVRQHPDGGMANIRDGRIVHMRD